MDTLALRLSQNWDRRAVAAPAWAAPYPMRYLEWDRIGHVDGGVPAGIAVALATALFQPGCIFHETMRRHLWLPFLSIRRWCPLATVGDLIGELDGWTYGGEYLHVYDLPPEPSASLPDSGDPFAVRSAPALVLVAGVDADGMLCIARCAASLGRFVDRLQRAARSGGFVMAMETP